MAPPSPTHYDVLGISRDADANEVRRAWKTLVQVWHPDRFSGAAVDDAQARAAAINDAYSTLRDAGRRAAYDCRLAADERERAAAAQNRLDAARAARRAPVVARGAGSSLFAPDAVVATASRPAAPLDQQLLEALSDAVNTARRHPRWSIATAAACLLTLVGIGVFNAATGPSLPGSLHSSTLARTERVSTSEQQSLEQLAAETARDADAAVAAAGSDVAGAGAGDTLVQQPAPHSELAAPPSAAAPTAVDPVAAAPMETPVAPVAAPRAPRAGKVQEIVKPDGTRVLRIMPG
ncbi:MAG: molecular chaperone DnaJ [Thermoleophilia bacterium]|nr:molecular chaperone DnaJ [Thermoleophilia bacterium]